MSSTDRIAHLFLDTNIILYYLRGDPLSTSIIEDNVIHISYVTEIELLGYHKIQKEERELITSMIDTFISAPVTEEIKNRAIYLRSSYNLKTADAIIAGTAWELNYPLVSSDSDFQKVSEINLITYESK